jgi:hypothetical protein
MVRKIMLHEPRGRYTGSHEIPWLDFRTGAPTVPRRPARSRRIRDRGGRRLPRRPSHIRFPLGRRFPRAGDRRAFGRCLPRPAPETDGHARGGRPPLADRRSHRARLPHRVVDRREDRPDDRAGVRRRLQPTRPQRLAAGPGLHPAGTPAGAPRARPGGARGLARHRRAAPQKRHGDRGPLSP